MTIFDYLLNVVLVGLVGLQMRGRRLDRRGLLLSLGLVARAASQYLHGIPTVGNDGLLVAIGVGAGLGLGVASARLTRLDIDREGVPVARATVAAAALWVLGIGARMGFSLYPARVGTRSSTEPCICRGPGRRTPSGCGRPGSPTTWRSRPNQPWPGR